MIALFCKHKNVRVEIIFFCAKKYSKLSVLIGPKFHFSDLKQSSKKTALIIIESQFLCEIVSQIEIELLQIFLRHFRSIARKYFRLK